jgi:hypothetical protein
VRNLTRIRPGYTSRQPLVFEICSNIEVYPGYKTILFQLDNNRLIYPSTSSLVSSPLYHKHSYNIHIQFAYIVCTLYRGSLSDSSTKNTSYSLQSFHARQCTNRINKEVYQHSGCVPRCLIFIFQTGWTHPTTVVHNVLPRFTTSS